MNFNYYLKLHQSGNLVEAEKGYRELIKKNRVSSELYCNIGIICFKTKREDEAKKFFDKSLKENSNNFIALNNLGLIYIFKKNFLKAKTYFEKASSVSENSKTFFYLGLIHTEIFDYENAIKNYKKSINLENNADSLCNLGDIYYNKGDLKNSRKYSELSLKANPKMDSALNNLGLIFLAEGNLEQARKKFLETLEINPQNSKAHFNITKITDYKKNTSHLKELKNNLENAEGDKDKSAFCFALSKLYHDIKEYSSSIDYLLKANSIIRKNISYSIKNDEILFNEIKNTLNLNTAQKHKGAGYDNKAPIFVLGMPRSGTSLVEQILASHSKVFGAGELNLLGDIIKKYFLDKKHKFIKEKINYDNLTNAGKEYSNKIKRIGNEKIFVINKLPSNFKWIGLIKLILPNSKIIHCSRDPIDTCFSIFQQNFYIRGNEYAFNLEEIASYYNLYSNLMLHWEKNFENSFLDVNYEKLVKNQKVETQKILNYCNLIWEDECLNFHETERVVLTSSDNQVRKKIYDKSIKKWELYKNWLQPLINNLN